jgi:heme exporter protein A
MNLQTGSITTSAHATTSDTDLAPRLKVSGLACRRGQARLFRDVSFTVLPGQMVWLRGANGSGKTTLLRTVAGLIQPDEGKLSWGVDFSSPSGARRPRVVYVGHLNGMKDDLTVCESLQFMAGLHGCDDTRSGALQALRQLGMYHRRNAPVRTLSQGQRRRTALARLALEEAPSLWILDEPFDALDADGIEAVNELLRNHLGRNGSVLLTSHLALSGAGVEVTELALDQGLSR